jgi:hypothetical protein
MPGEALHSERNDAIAPMSLAAATRTTTSAGSQPMRTVVAERWPPSISGYETDREWLVPESAAVMPRPM